MKPLSIEDGFDVHEYRHGLKLLREDREAMHLVNRRDYACPACGEPFDRLFVSGRRTVTFGTPDRPFCVARTEDQLLVLTH